MSVDLDELERACRRVPEMCVSSEQPPSLLSRSSGCRIGLMVYGGEADAIATIRNAAPAILAELRALRAERDGLRAALDRLADERVEYHHCELLGDISLVAMIDDCLGAAGIDIMPRLGASRAGKDG